MISDMKKYIILFVLLVAVLAVSVPVFNFISRERHALTILKICRTIEPGITVSELGSLMGAPIDISENTNLGIHYYYYNSPIAASELTSVHLKEGKVVLLNCGEGYRRY